MNLYGDSFAYFARGLHQAMPNECGVAQSCNQFIQQVVTRLHLSCHIYKFIAVANHIGIRIKIIRDLELEEEW